MSGSTLPTARPGAARIAAIGAAALLALSSVGCADSETSGTDATATGSIRIADQYVKSAAGPGTTDMAAMAPMSAAFMSITNDGDAAVTLTGGSTPVAERVEIHEVVDGTMQPIAGGLVIDAGATALLQPGGNHVMLMGLTESLEVGDEVELTLTFSGAEPVTVTAPVKEVPGADEPYDAGPNAGPNESPSAG